MLELNKIYNINCLQGIKELPDNSIDCVITSPPYWALRDYNIEPVVYGGNINCKHDWNNNICNKCGAWLGQLGQEPNYIMYIDHIIEIFTEIKRILKPTGTVWINLGDTYGGTGHKYNYKDPKYKKGRNGQSYAVNHNAPQKCLLQIPNRIAIKMLENGWILRNEIIWHKGNAFPQSVKDRFTVDYEKIFFFVKNKKYYFKQQFEPYTSPLNRWGGSKIVPKNKSLWDEGTGQNTYRERDLRPNPKGRNKRCVWTINTKPLKESHFAAFPEELAEICLDAGSPENGIVLDPFMGSGTTAIVAIRQNKNFIGFELNPDYIKIANKRIQKMQA